MAISIYVSSLTYNSWHLNRQFVEDIRIGLDHGVRIIRCHDWGPIDGHDFACLERFGFRVNDDIAGEA